MAWEVFRREDGFEGRDEPFISVRSDHLAFNATFVRISAVGAGKHVTIHVDSENRKIALEFHDEKRPNSFALAQQYRGSGRRGHPGLQCTCVALLKKYSWVRSVTALPAKERRFRPQKEGKLWVIHLCPAFEEQRARESADIPPGITGVYRYVRETGEIVYIGRGDIKKRLASPNRAEWDFDRVEYSVVADPDQQVKWETYWLERFKYENGGRLPFYNRVSGAAIAEERSSRAGHGTGGEQKNDNGR